MLLLKNAAWVLKRINFTLYPCTLNQCFQQPHTMSQSARKPGSAASNLVSTRTTGRTPRTPPPEPCRPARSLGQIRSSPSPTGPSPSSPRSGRTLPSLVRVSWGKRECRGQIQKFYLKIIKLKLPFERL